MNLPIPTGTNPDSIGLAPGHFQTMLNFPAIFFLIALAAAGMGFTGVATSSPETVQGLFYIFFLGAIASIPVRKKTQN